MRGRATDPHRGGVSAVARPASRAGVPRDTARRVRLVRYARSRRIGRAAMAFGALLVGLAFTTSVAGALVATADVSVVIASPPGSLVPGTSFTWTLVARNSGAATAHDVVVSSSLPAGVTVVSPPPACLVGSAVRCTPGGLEAGAGVPVGLDLSIQHG